MVPELIVGSVILLVSIIVIIFFPELAIALIEFQGKVSTDQATIMLRRTFFTWIASCITTGILFSYNLHTSNYDSTITKYSWEFFAFRSYGLLYNRSLLSVHDDNRRNEHSFRQELYTQYGPTNQFSLTRIFIFCFLFEFWFTFSVLLLKQLRTRKKLWL